MARRTWCTVLVAVVVSVLGAIAPAAAGADEAPLPPVRPAGGQPGGPGPCAAGASLSLPNLQLSGVAQTVWVFTPTGTGVPVGGGRCDDAQRPVAVVVHGWSGVIPTVYRDLIDDLVSHGHVVVFANHSLLWAPEVTYRNVWSGIRQATGWMDQLLGGRMDLDHLGIWGHSSGAGMVPWLAQQAAASGWGSSSMWLSLNASHFAFKVGTSGPIQVPSHARVQVIAYEEDGDADHGIGIDIFESLTVPDSQKDHIQLLSDGPFLADHHVPISWMFRTLPPDHLDWYGVHRNTQVLSSCARAGIGCDADLTFMGTWSDGTEAPRAVVSDDPVDMGPPTSSECSSFSMAWLLGTPHLCAGAP